MSSANIVKPAGAVDAIVRDLTDARRELFEALDELGPAAWTEPGLVGEWSARELIAHLGYWVGHAVDAIHHVASGRGAEFEVGADAVQQRNAIVARVARESTLDAVLKRERESFEALVARLGHLDPVLLDERLANWGTLGEGILEDGPRHYRDHASELRARRAAPGTGD